jgi:hypothetical protein
VARTKFQTPPGSGIGKYKEARPSSLEALELLIRLIEKSPALRKDRLAILQATLRIIIEAIERVGAPSLEKAPAFWLNRQDRSQSPFDFVKKVYADYYDSGLTKNKIRQLDRSLYNALNKFKNQEPEDFNLPTLKEQNDAMLADLGVRPELEENIPTTSLQISKLYRVVQTRRRRSGKKIA